MNSYFELGGHSWPITTRNADAQLWFDRGLIWAYGFNFEAATDCFSKAAEADPACVMAHWGVAYAAGCNYNRPWRTFLPGMVSRAMRRARRAVQQGKLHRDVVSAKEAALLDAIERRFQAEGVQSTAVLMAWNDEYVDAMRTVYLSYPDDLDVATLLADALLSRTPWKLWDIETGRAAQQADTEEAVVVLERALGQADAGGVASHPGLLHAQVHLMEMSPHPERALRAARLLQGLVPASGHLEHMRSHIEILCGNYAEAVAANDRAIAADRAFRARHGEMLEYAIYCAHNIHSKIYAAMLLGQLGKALEGAREMQLLIDEQLLRTELPPMAAVLEGLVSVKLHVLIRFGRWRDILLEPIPDDPSLYCNTIAMLHYARGIAYANTGNLDAALAEREAFARSQSRLREDRYILNNTCADILGVAQCMLDGEIEYHRANYDLAFDQLRRAVYLDDHLEYVEPWGWMMPARHALGALLLARGHAREALAVYRADLGLDGSLYRALQHPRNVWSLQGCVSALRRLGERDEADRLQAELGAALAAADVEISASCFCAISSEPSCCD